MKKLEISGIARLLSLLAALALARPALAAEDTLELAPRNVKGKKERSRFDEIRNRSRDVLEWKPSRRAKDPNVIAEFVGEATIPGAQIWMYPAGAGYPLPGMTDAQAHTGRFALEMTLKADAYSGGAVCSPAPLDLTRYIDKGMLELWVRGAEGQEVFSIGMLDNGNNPMGRPLQVWVNSRSFSKVGKDGWSRIRIPIKAFGARGSYWSEELNTRIYSQLNLTSISCFSVDIDKERHKAFKVWFDDVKLYKVGPGGAVGGAGYAVVNEEFEDFPVAAAKGKEVKK